MDTLKTAFILFFALSSGLQCFAKANKFGGTFKLSAPYSADSLNPFTTRYNETSTLIRSYIHETLLIRHHQTGKWSPLLATDWDIDKKKLMVDFTLRKNATFSDGQRVTAADVKFSFDAINNPQYKAALLKNNLAEVSRCQILGPHKVRFFLKKADHSAFRALATFEVYPLHVYSQLKNWPQFSKKAFGSGPYYVKVHDKGKKTILYRNPKWWGYSVSELKNRYFFDQIIVKVIAKDHLALKKLKKGEIDFLKLPISLFTRQKATQMWGKDYFAVKAPNSIDSSYTFIAWNHKNPLFNQSSARRAMSYLFNRKLMAQKFGHGLIDIIAGPTFEKSVYRHPAIKPIEFDPTMAAELLKMAGWRDSDDNRILDQVIDGKKVEFKFTLYHANQDYEKYALRFKNQAQKIGVQVDIRQLEWANLNKLLDERKFAAVMLRTTGGDLDWGPKETFHSSSIKNKGNNFFQYNNPALDQLIDKAQSEFDPKERIPILREVYKVIADDAVFTFLFAHRYYLYAYTKGIRRPVDTFAYELGLKFWWREL